MELSLAHALQNLTQQDIRKDKDQLFVTKPSLPPQSDVEALLSSIWESRIVTNRGPILQQLERALEQFLDVPHVSLVANATLGCMVAMHALGVSRGLTEGPAQAGEQGEVITTGFSFVATAHAVRWLGLEPVFADIDPVTLNIDPSDVERRITPRTRAIFPVHCYGNPCDTAALDQIGKRHGIPVIYDAAHCFGARDNGGSLLRHGALSVVSFHATKVFSTGEGGAIISHDPQTKQAVDRLCNYGIVDETRVETLGLNAKMSELHAAVGLAQLPHARANIDARARVCARYSAALAGLPGISQVCPIDRKGHNYYNFPILVGPDYPLTRDELYQRLANDGIHVRRYFHPLLTDLPMYRDPNTDSRWALPHARRASDRVLCLPLYPELTQEDQDRVIAQITAPCA